MFSQGLYYLVSIIRSVTMKLDKLCNKQDEYMTPRYAIKPLLVFEVIDKGDI